MTTNQFMKKVFAYFNAKQESGVTLTDEERELMLEAESKTESFPITSLHFDDLKGATDIISPLPDNVMETIADKMGEDYCEQLFWVHLPMIADIVIDRMGIEVERKDGTEEDEEE